MSLRVGVDETRFGLVNRLRKGGQFQLLANGAPQLSGFIDKVAIESSHSGTSVSVSGRDILSPVVDSHIDRKLAVKKNTSLVDPAKLVLHTEFELPVTFGTGSLTSRPIARPSTEHATAWSVMRSRHVRSSAGARRWTRSRRSARDRTRGHSLTFLRFRASRRLPPGRSQTDRACSSGNRNYDQDAIGELVNLRGGAGGTNTIERASITSDNTSVPSHVYVYGKSNRGRGTEQRHRAGQRGRARSSNHPTSPTTRATTRTTPTPTPSNARGPRRASTKSSAGSRTR